MLKNVLNLEGAQQLSKNEQKAIKGGISEACNFAILDGYCIKRNGTQPCSGAYPAPMNGGCCCQL